MSTFQNLAAEKTYNDLDVSLRKANEHRNAWFEGVRKCTVNESLFTIMERIVRAEVHRLVITDDNSKVIGIISLSDILLFLVLRPSETSVSASTHNISVRSTEIFNIPDDDAAADKIDEATEDTATKVSDDSNSKMSERISESGSSEANTANDTNLNGIESETSITQDDDAESAASKSVTNADAAPTESNNKHSHTIANAADEA